MGRNSKLDALAAAQARVAASGSRDSHYVLTREEARQEALAAERAQAQAAAEKRVADHLAALEAEKGR